MNSVNNLLVTCHIANRIKEYTTSGSLVREIVLNEFDVSCPWHAIELTNGQLVVSHRGRVHDVSVVYTREVVTRASRNLQSTNNKPFKGPRQLAVCGNGHILVADYNNNRIVELNDSLTWSRDLPLPVPDGLQQPYCLYLDKSRDRLYVGECGDNKRVLVFDNFSNSFL